MRKIKTDTKLKLNTETIRLLMHTQLADVIGGSNTTTYNEKATHTCVCNTGAAQTCITR